MSVNYQEVLKASGNRGNTTISINVIETASSVLSIYKTEALDCVEELNHYAPSLYAREKCNIAEVPSNGHYNTDFADVSLVLRHTGASSFVSKKFTVNLLEVPVIYPESFADQLREVLSLYQNGISLSEFFIESATFNFTKEV